MKASGFMRRLIGRLRRAVWRGGTWTPLELDVIKSGTGVILVIQLSDRELMISIPHNTALELCTAIQETVMTDTKEWSH